jgi:hypothetical protein
VLPGMTPVDTRVCLGHAASMFRLELGGMSMLSGQESTAAESRRHV